MGLAVVMLTRPANPNGIATPNARRDYAAEYGGNPTAYARIAALTDCSELQGEFDRAAANNDAATPGTPPHRASLGFMTASVDRMKEVGCP